MLKQYTPNIIFGVLVICTFLFPLNSWGQECLSGNCENGKGLYLFESGDIYEGDFKNGKRHGKGVYSWKNGKKYEGRFENGNIEGKGTFTWPSGNKFKGNYKNNKIDGRGIFEWADGRSYDGEYKDGKMEGIGIYSWPDGYRYEGAFKNNLRHGMGIYVHANGERYQGEYVEGKKQGKGVYEWPDGRRYEGQYFQDEMQGMGILLYANGDIFSGQFDHGEKTKNGSLISAEKDLSIEENLQPLVSEAEGALEILPLDELSALYTSTIVKQGERIVKTKNLNYPAGRNWIQTTVYLKKRQLYKLAVLAEPGTKILGFSFINQGTETEWIVKPGNKVVGEFRPYLSGSYTIKIKAESTNQLKSTIQLNYIVSSL